MHCILFLFALSCTFLHCASQSSQEAHETPDTSRVQPDLELSELTAADIDDNLNHKFYNKWVRNQQDVQKLLPINVGDRVSVQIKDKDKIGFSHAKLEFKPPGLVSQTGSDGRFYFFPWFDGVKEEATNFTLTVSSPLTVETREVNFTREDKEVAAQLPVRSVLPTMLDLMFVIDATGSMGDEIAYITKELRDIVIQVSKGHKDLNIQYGLIMYRDHGDDFVVNDMGFVSSLSTMQAQLDAQDAEGGGDFEEAMDEALQAAMKARWRAGNVARILFLVADAPPHDNKLPVTLNTVHEARKKGIHIYGLAGSGVEKRAEYILRALAALSVGRHLWLTDDSGIGGSHAEPKVECYRVTHLNNLLTRIIQSELLGRRIEAPKEQIIREVGKQEAGVCIVDLQGKEDEDKKEDDEKDKEKEGAIDGKEETKEGGTGGHREAHDVLLHERSTLNAGGGAWQLSANLLAMGCVVLLGLFSH
eukprot:TRINITY_DN48986_c0_g1_i1.p1 TRINITY_DN48986_c0_g1~~TRINITY_DN48986_c0_g1_i1.p1  ORF type:complete len:475 (-),score=61.13 TRINITY_DN48986_c0_g1_i1:1142-2566(-)